MYFAIARCRFLWLRFPCRGGKDGVVAQLVERLVRNEKVRGSTPLGSTILRSEPTPGGPEWRMVFSIALAEEDLLLISSELRMAGQLI